METGAADAVGLTDAHLALACASHQGERRHVTMAADWLSTIGLSEPALRCGAHEPYDRVERNRLIKTDSSPCQLHNNCSGKHCGFLTVTQHMKAGPEYVEVDHPLQRAIRQATEEVTGETVAGYGIDGCSAPNFAVSITGLARAMALFANASEGGDTRSRAMHRLTRAMATYPELVAGEGRACTELMRAMGGKVTLKTGAEAVFVAILPEQKLGMAVKITDGGDARGRSGDHRTSGAGGGSGRQPPGGAKAAWRHADQLARAADRRNPHRPRLSGLTCRVNRQLIRQSKRVDFRDECRSAHPVPDPQPWHG